MNKAAARRRLFLVALGCLLLVPSAPAQEEQRIFDVRAQKYTFEPARIEVNQNDLVKITLSSSDIAHSFVIDDYRISKRVTSDRPVTFEFRADRPGTFPFYCNLEIDDGCRKMRGEIVVRAR